MIAQQIMQALAARPALVALLQSEDEQDGQLRVYRARAPQDCCTPFMTFQDLTEEENEHLEERGGASISVGNTTTRYQFDIFALDADLADQIWRECEQALRGNTDFATTRQNRFTGYEGDTRLYRVTSDYSIIHDGY